PATASETRFLPGPRTTSHPNPVRNKPTSCPVRYRWSETPRLRWSMGATNAPRRHPAGRPEEPPTRTQTPLTIPHSPYTAWADAQSGRSPATEDSGLRLQAQALAVIAQMG